MKVKVYPAARRHGVSRHDMLHVVAAAVGVRRFTKGEWTVVWIGDDPYGREVEIIAVLDQDMIKVIHAMPTAMRRRRS